MIARLRSAWAALTCRGHFRTVSWNPSATPLDPQPAGGVGEDSDGNGHALIFGCERWGGCHEACPRLQTFGELTAFREHCKATRQETSRREPVADGSDRDGERTEVHNLDTEQVGPAHDLDADRPHTQSNPIVGEVSPRVQHTEHRTDDGDAQREQLKPSCFHDVQAAEETRILIRQAAEQLSRDLIALAERHARSVGTRQRGGYTLPALLGTVGAALLLGWLGPALDSEAAPEPASPAHAVAASQLADLAQCQAQYGPNAWAVHLPDGQHRCTDKHGRRLPKVGHVEVQP